MKATSGLMILSVLLLAGCSVPSFVNKGEGESSLIGLNDVTFQVTDSFKQAPPDCVAVLPFTALPTIAPEDVAKVRLSFFAHLSTQSKRTIRLERVDHELALSAGDRKALGERLKCGALIEGKVSQYGATFLGIYSRVAVGIDLKMTRASDGHLLWEADHVAVSHGGSVPLDPVGVAMGVVDAVTNIRDEQILRITDDATRRLVSTIPDNRVSALDDPDDQTVSPSRPAPQTTEMAEMLFANGDTPAALSVINRILATNPDDAKAWFLKGRLLMLDQNFAQAEPAFIRAVSIDPGNAKFLNGLGAVNAAKGNLDRALAAYEMALAANPANGFAWYNSAVIYYNQGKLAEASDGFYAAGLAYAKNADYAKAERALSDLNDLAKAGVPLAQKISALQNAIAVKLRSQS
jgi:Flp pilus assembly protein TadD